MPLEDDVGFRRETYIAVRLPPRTVPLASDIKVFYLTERGQKEYAVGTPTTEMIEGVHYFYVITIPFRHTPLEVQMQFEGRDVDGKFNREIYARNTYERRNGPNRNRDFQTDRVRAMILKADGSSNRQIAAQLSSSEKYVRNLLERV